MATPRPVVGPATTSTDLTTFSLRSLVPAIEADGIVVLDFWAPGCGTCHRFSPVFERVASARSGAGVVFGTVNTDDEQQLAAMFGVQSLPTVVIIRDGTVVFVAPGPFTGRDLMRILDQVA